MEQGSTQAERDKIKRIAEVVELFEWFYFMKGQDAVVDRFNCYQTDPRNIHPVPKPYEVHYILPLAFKSGLPLTHCNRKEFKRILIKQNRLFQFEFGLNSIIEDCERATEGS